MNETNDTTNQLSEKINTQTSESTSTFQDKLSNLDRIFATRTIIYDEQTRQKESALREQLFADQEIKNCGIGSRFHAANLQTIHPRSEHQKNAIALLTRYFDSSFEAGEGLLLYGEPAGGKTHLIACALKHAAKLLFKKYSNNFTSVIKYITAEEFFISLRACMDKHSSQNELDTINDLARIPVLAIDDLYLSESEYQHRMLWHLLDRRYQNKKPTIVSTNLTIDEFKNTFEKRLYRRLEATLIFVG